MVGKRYYFETWGAWGELVGQPMKLGNTNLFAGKTMPQNTDRNRGFNLIF
jgi:hypothetical protein